MAVGRRRTGMEACGRLDLADRRWPGAGEVAAAAARGRRGLKRRRLPEGESSGRRHDTVLESALVNRSATMTRPGSSVEASSGTSYAGFGEDEADDEEEARICGRHRWIRPDLAGEVDGGARDQPIWLVMAKACFGDEDTAGGGEVGLEAMTRSGGDEEICRR